MHFRRLFLYCTLFGWLLAFQLAAQQPSTTSGLQLRPNAAIGLLDGEAVYAAGLRALLDAGNQKYYGLEFSRFQPNGAGQEFYTAGIVLEQQLFGWFHSAIGTIGYFGFGAESTNAVGLTSSLGWAPASQKRVRPCITYRSDLIFTAKTQVIHSLNAGISIRL